MVQKGPIGGLAIRKTSDSNDKGWGVFAQNDIAKGTFVCEYAGEIIGSSEAQARLDRQQKNGESNYILVSNENSGKKGRTHCPIEAKTHITNIS